MPYSDLAINILAVLSEGTRALGRGEGDARRRRGRKVEREGVKWRIELGRACSLVVCGWETGRLREGNGMDELWWSERGSWSLELLGKQSAYVAVAAPTPNPALELYCTQ